MKTLTHTLLSRPLRSALCALLTASALTLAAAVPVVRADETRYEPIAAITAAFGSKSVIGYYVQNGGTCDVTLLLGEQDAQMPPSSPARLRLVLQPGAMAGLDSEEGRSLNLTCSEDTATLRVESGETHELVAAQAQAHPRLTAKRQRQ